MQIFNYSWKNGKGDVIGHVKYSGNGCSIGKHCGYPVHESLNTVEYEKNTPVWADVTADDFGAEEAILFCTGSWKCGEDKERWEWMIVPTKAMAEKAKGRNRKLLGHAHN